ncbi:MAG: hypothetical protein JSS59_03030 [Proteobacteria bacterium]|uniref:hypothetical protein n=1 Tax=Rudaea sp. TaxID=2136325 RepID=UPI003784D8BF|nr:hypothetical protein [Pseudomonadota bacterium]
MPASPASAPLNETTARFLQSGVSITVAARNRRLVPSIAKAVGCRVETDGSVALFLFVNLAETVCADVAENAQVAACFSRPSTNQTVQIKGSDARCEPALPADIVAARRCLDLLSDDLVPLGFGSDLLEAFFWGDPEKLVALHFTPEAAFVQTPGPQAGAVLRG